MARIIARPQRPRAKQNGQALLALLVILGIGFAAVIYGLVSPASLTLETDKITNAALAQAKEALIGYAARDSNRPGSLPCPDTDNNGSAQLFAGSYCPSQVGRLPWRTLGLPDLRDGGGDRLWYAVSRDFSRNPAGAPALNTNTAGQLTISGTAPANNVIAIVFAPGLVVGSQVRDTANVNTVANYLEGGNEASGATTFTTGAVSATFNDKLLAVTTDALFSVVEMRVAREARAVLQAFYGANGFFPFANAYSDTSYQCTDNQQSDRVPRFFTDNCKVDPADPDWKGVTWPGWFFNNNWHRVVFYAVASKCAKPSSPACSHAAGGMLTVNNMPPPNNDIRAIIITPGRGFAGQTRPCAAVTDCLEDSENTNGDSVFVKSAMTSTVNDRLVVVAP